MDNKDNISAEGSLEDKLMLPISIACENIDYIMNGNNEEYISKSDSLSKFDDLFYDLATILHDYISLVVKDSSMLKNINANYMAMDENLRKYLENYESETENVQ